MNRLSYGHFLIFLHSQIFCYTTWQVMTPLLIVVLNPYIGQHSYNFAPTTAWKLKDGQSHKHSNYILDLLCLTKIYAAMLRLDLSVSCCHKIKTDLKIIIRYDSFVKQL